MNTLVLVNRSSGAADATTDEVRAAFTDAQIVECDPDELGARARAAGTPTVGVAGGDGTIRTVAEALAHTDTALLPIPAGTLNHFAKTLGINTVADAAAATGERQIDIARVNDHRFVNNSSVGFYPGLVRGREARESTLPKWLAAIVATWHACWTERSLTVRLDDRAVKAWLVFVGNNRYGDSIRDLGSRDRIDEGVLDVGVVRADHAMARVRFAAAVLFGRLGRSPVVDRFRCDAITIDVEEHRMVDVALDGEVTEVASPLNYEIEPGALRVRVPA